MKLITALYLVLLIAIITGCGPHFLGKPEPYVEPAPPVAVDMVKPAPQTVKVNLPNWPLYAYHHKDPDIIIIMVIKDPSIKAPAAFVLTDEEKKLAYKVQMVEPKK